MTVLPSGHLVRRVPFDETYLERSAVWLQDEELRHLIRSAPYDPAQARAWFEGLPSRPDYVVFGIECDGQPVGMLNLKFCYDDGALYSMYVGERAFWRAGIGTWALREVQGLVRERGLRKVYGRIAAHNTRSQQAHLAMGMRHVADEGDEWVMVIDVEDEVGSTPRN